MQHHHTAHTTQPTTPAAAAEHDLERMRAAVTGRVASRSGQRPTALLPESEVVRCEQENYLGDARLFALLRRGQSCFVRPAGKWLIWGGHSWLPDPDARDTLAAVDLVAREYLRVAEALRRQAADPNTDSGGRRRIEATVAALLARAKRLRGKDRRAVLDFNQAGEASLAVDGDWLDADPWLLGTGNGVIDLRTGTFREGRPEDGITLTTAVPWAGFAADYTPFVGFLAHMLGDDAELLGFMLRFLGMSLFGGQREHVFLVLFGEGGRNGKDTLMSILGDALGEDLCGPIKPELLMEQTFMRDAAKPAPEIMELRGKRIVYASESGRRHRFDAELVKRFTGGGKESARGLLENHITKWERTHTLILLTNELPEAPADDEAFWERLHGIELKRRYVDRPDPSKPEEFAKDPDIREKMEPCLSGILTCLVLGFGEYLRQGLNPPPAVTAFGRSYRMEEDLVGRFLEDCCAAMPGREDPRTRASELYDCFSWWHGRNVSRRVTVNQRRFSLGLRKRGFQTRKVSANYYLGVAIRPEVREEWEHEAGGQLRLGGRKS